MTTTTSQTMTAVSNCSEKPSLNIPVISLDQPRPQAIAAIRSACQSHGFFQLTNHPVPAELIASIFNYMRLFFDLPGTEKLNLSKRNHVEGGYERWGAYGLDLNTEDSDLNEGFCIAPEWVDKEQEESLNWPPEQGATETIAGFRATCREYYGWMESLSSSLGALISEGLGLPSSYFKPCFTKQLSHLRLMHYNSSGSSTAVSAREAHRKLGAGAHTDWGIFTLLLQDDVGGLQVLSPADSTTWLPVTPTPGAFVVNVGDLLSRLTNYTYRSAKHRVLPPPAGVERYSVPYFNDCNPDWVVHVLDLGGRAKPKDIVAGDWFREKFEISRRKKEKDAVVHVIAEA